LDRFIELPKELGIAALPEDTPELALAGMLDQYRNARIERMEGQPRKVRNQFELLITQLLAAFCQVYSHTGLHIFELE
jgi:hypothetical protein